jgi:LPS sulfotransferase NodH
LRFIFIERLDKIAQAVSLARALQTNAWFAFDKQDKMPLVYELDFLEDCLREILAQSNGWKAWFSESGIEPMLVHYEDMIADTPGMVQQVVRCLGVENDEPDPVVLPPPIQRQADQVNAEWARRFRQDSELARAWAGNELTAAAQ